MNGFHLGALQLLLSGLAGASSQTDDLVQSYTRLLVCAPLPLRVRSVFKRVEQYHQWISFVIYHTCGEFHVRLSGRIQQAVNGTEATDSEPRI